MRTRKFIALVVAALMVVSVAAGCKPTTENTPPPATSEPASQPASSQTTQATPTPAPSAETPSQAPANPEDNFLKFGTTGLDGNFNPILSDNVYDSAVNHCIFDYLVDNDAAGMMIPGDITEKWELSNNNLTYTFTLKDGIKFWDGTPLTAEDVAFTYLTVAHADYDGPRTSIVSDLVGYEDYHSGATTDFEGIKVIDPLHISFTFNDGSASPANIENFAYPIMSKAYYQFDDYTDFTDLKDKPMGSGPFKFDSWAPEEFVKLVRNEEYWNPDQSRHAKIDGILILTVPTESQISALQTREIDFIDTAASMDNYNSISQIATAKPVAFLSNGYTHMQFNCYRPPFDDVRVRQAFLYALDRQTFVDTFYGAELGKVGLAPLSPTSWAFPDASELDPYALDLDKAASLLDEAGWKLESDGYRYKDGNKLTVHWLVYTDSPWPGVLSALAADSWKSIGIDLVIDVMDFVTVAARTGDPAPGEKDFDIYTMGFSLSIDPDPKGGLFDGDEFKAGGFNASGFIDQKNQDLIQKGRTTFDQAERAKIYKEWAAYMNEMVPTCPVAYRSYLYGIDNRVHGLDVGTFQSWSYFVRTLTLDPK